MEHSIGQVAVLAGITVRALHHYDRIGLLRPSGRSAGGYRVYDDADLDRLHRVLAYRELGFTLDQVAQIVDDPQADTPSHLRRQHAVVRSRIQRLESVLGHIEKEMEALQMGISLSREEQFEVFGENWLGDGYAAEAEQRWGDTPAWEQSQRRTAAYTKQDWLDIKAETEQVEAAMAQALAAGTPASDPAAMDLAEQLRQQIDTRFYECPPAMHRGLGDMYVADPRFTEHYEGRRPGLAQYVRDAIHANADRLEPAGS